MRPRSDRRRRGHDFLANYHRALEPAHNGEVDVVIHAGDVFDRPTVAASVAYQAYEPLRRVTDLGIPVLVVPGNHERSRLPHCQLLTHATTRAPERSEGPRSSRFEGIHVFDVPRTVVVNVRGTDVAFSGIPYARRVRAQFPALLEETKWRDAVASHRVLCVHHCFEGATVGPADYVFTTAADVIRHADIPRDFAAVFTGHVHRHQVLSVGLDGRRLATPVLYPGSIERTAFAEMGETKGFMLVRLSLDASGRSAVAWEFRPLPARPMHRIDIRAAEDAQALARAVRDAIASVPADAVLGLRIHGELTDAHWGVISARSLRAIVPSTMNVTVMPTAARDLVRPRYSSPDQDAADTEPQLALF